MGNLDNIDLNLLLIYRSLWRLSKEDLELFCARYGVSEVARRIMLSPPVPVKMTLLPVVLAES